MPRSHDDQRPTGAHWGAYATAADLPNAKGSAARSPELTRGDLAFVEDEGELYVCHAPVDGRADWRRAFVPPPPPKVKRKVPRYPEAPKPPKVKRRPIVVLEEESEKGEG